MKKYFYLTIATVIFSSCTKDINPGSSGGTTTVTNSPNLITLSYQPGIPINLR